MELIQVDAQATAAVQLLKFVVVVLPTVYINQVFPSHLFALSFYHLNCPYSCFVSYFLKLTGFTAPNTLTNYQELAENQIIMSPNGTGFATLYPNGSLCTAQNYTTLWCSPLPSTPFPHYYAAIGPYGLCVFGRNSSFDEGLPLWCTLAKVTIYLRFIFC